MWISPPDPELEALDALLAALDALLADLDEPEAAVLEVLFEFPQATSPTDIAATSNIAILFFIVFFLLL